VVCVFPRSLAIVSRSDRLGLKARRQPDEPPEILRYPGLEELGARAAESAEPHSFKAERGLQMRKWHLDFLSLVSRAFDLRRACKLSGLIARFLVDASRDFPSFRVGQQRALSSHALQSSLLAR
jgi:hypothetical protein